jgi:ribulose-5-phosphate 4-epimerase/fuculose-1-phosphate aldolase
VHLHSTHSVAVSCLPDTDPDCALPPLTPYSLMQCGRIPMLPYFKPGDLALADAIRGVAGKHSAVLLANHGPIVAGKSLETAMYATEELEATAKLHLLTRGLNPRLLTPDQIAALS